MSDTPTPDAPAADAPPPAAEAPPVVPAEAEELDLDGELTEQTYDAAYVKKLRAQAARYRTERNEHDAKIKALYDGIEDPSDVEFLVGMLRKLNDDPASTAKDFEDIAKRIREATGIEVDATDLQEEPEADKPLTRADLEQIERERAIEAATRQIQAEANSLGYKDGTPEYAQLIWLANNDKDAKGDLQKAHAKILGNLDAVKQAAVQEYIESVRAGNAAFPAISAPGGSGPAGSPNEGGPKDFKSASASALARLEAAM